MRKICCFGSAYFPFLPVRESSVPGTEIQEGFAWHVYRANDLGKEDGMVSGFDNLADAALHLANASGDQRNTGALAGSPFHRLEPVACKVGKPCGKVLLIDSENIYSEPGTPAEVGEQTAAVIDADENQRRTAGDGCKGINRQPVGPFVVSCDGGYSYSSGKLRANTTKCVRADAGKSATGFGEAP